ncbi:MAG: hypothetical protein F4118_01080 [Acidimicrobiaceae bacterium]|nr:hypothetical protein [Acidimicrobiaceae bacterium]MYA98673.1 hypothetical protein [Candidatus Poribacteria bacterium]MYI35010.1 hypothetical protein [Acidimicrobiaceae bacterium]
MSEAKITLITNGKDGLQRVEIREPFDPMELDEFCVSLAEAWTGAIDDPEQLAECEALAVNLYGLLSEAGD